MKQAIILHGSECEPSDYWYPWPASQLEQQGFSVTVPYMPEINQESASDTIDKLDVDISDNTVLVGHSSGAVLVLALLERFKVDKAILVGGYMSEIGEPGDNQSIQDSYNVDAIKSNAGEIIYFNSTNDPWGCNDVRGKEMQDTFGGRLIVMSDGHFGSTSYDQPYKEFPELLEVIT